MPLDRRDIEAALALKGFEKEDKTNHRFYALRVDGKRTGIGTLISRGSGYRQYPDSLLGKVATQLHLTKKQLLQLIECTLSAEELIALLKEAGVI